MNGFNIYEIRLAKNNELKSVQVFINNYWRKGHVLSFSKKLFYFQHGNGENGYFDYAIAKNTITGSIDGVFGFINARRYDSSRCIPNLIWGALWKVRPDVHNDEIGSVGLALLSFILKNNPGCTFLSVGISDVHLKIAEALHFNCGNLEHYYITNKAIKKFKIALNPLRRDSVNQNVQRNLYIKKFNIKEPLDIHNDINPYKNIEFFRGRYLRHPFYHYDFYGVTMSERLKVLFVIRKIDISAGSVLRIVDMIGNFDGIGDTSTEFQKILKEEEAEYIDCLNYGIDESVFNKMGFCLLGTNKDTVIPEYFEPFERRNVVIRFAGISDSPLVIFKGDADQDRPNVL